ncbi:MAG TPA: hypothetical protein PKC43_07785 [Phycisphaerales bacterium]|nr:hypothetical protein [Phycisphaerales bacterium]HMP37337.1 hypothetical protein [Phycisphaerales bacterium]
MHPLTERVAIRAAQYVAEGSVRDVAGAIRVALEREHAPPGAAPTAGLVRRHLAPMLMQVLGAEGYPAMLRGRLELAESVMTVLEEHVDVIGTLLVGRAAAGRLDGDMTLHIRVYTRRRIGDIAEDLVTFGFEEPRFVTVESRIGRLDRLLFECDGVAVAVTRCLPERRMPQRGRGRAEGSRRRPRGLPPGSATDLVRGTAVATLDLERLREFLAALDEAA